MLSAPDVRRLLDKLCVELGFCLRRDEVERLADEPPGDVRAFTDEVFRSEGIDPTTADRLLYRKVRDAVAAAFERSNDK